uniref:Uncharacterized protein n=1 Tax=Arundo donax TaxID=35708 RepID=A0A0A9SR51_ARUDO
MVILLGLKSKLFFVRVILRRGHANLLCIVPILSDVSYILFLSAWLLNIRNNVLGGKFLTLI